MNITKKIFPFLLLTCFCRDVRATAQIPDVIILEKDTLALFSNPLGNYLMTDSLIGFSGCYGSACWRGYKAIWEVKKDSLFLLRITSCFKGCGAIKDADLPAMFKEKYKNGRVYANWVTEELIVPHGRLIRYVHMGYSSLYEKNYRIKVRHGKVKQTNIETNYFDDENRIDRVDFFQAKLHIYQTIQNKIEWSSLPNDEEGIAYEDFVLTIGRNGSIVFVKNPYGESKRYKREIKRIVKELGKWDIISINGKKRSEKYSFSLEIDHNRRTVLDELFEKDILENNANN